MEEKMENLPYAQQSGTLIKMLDKIKVASVPDNFSQDFVSTKLSMSGGTARSTMPFIKKMGLVAPDGTPTDRYIEFRNPDKSGYAIADSVREVYSRLFEMNEYVYELDSSKLKSLIIEATGAEAESTPVAKTLATFNALNKLANFELPEPNSSKNLVDEEVNTVIPISDSSNSNTQNQAGEGINLSYTINLNLPATKEIEVFNAIFKSLKQHLLQD